MTTPLERMEAIMASLVPERSQMNTGNAPINKLNANVSGNDAPKLTKSQRRKRRKTLMKIVTADLGSLEKREDIGIRSAGTGEGKSSNFIGKEHTKVATGETGSSLTTNLNREVEVQKAMETTTGNTSSGTNATDNTVSKKRKRNRKKMNNNNPDLGDTLRARESTHEGCGMTKVLEVTCNETVASNTTTPDANLVSIEEVANIKTGKSDVNGNGMEKSKKKSDLDNKRPTLAEILNPRYPQSLDLDNKRPTLAEILNPRYPQSLEASKGETGSGTTSTDKPASKKQKGQKLNKNPDLGDTLSTHESTQEGLSTTKVLEPKKDEMISAKTATPDANMVPKEQVHTEVFSGRTGESEATNNGNDPPMLTKSQKKNRRKALKKKLGSLERREGTENPNSVGPSATVDNKTSMSSPAGTTNLIGKGEVQKKLETSSGTNATDNTTLKKRKREKLKNNDPESGDNLSNHESTQEGLCTTKVLELKSDETVSAKTATPDANMVSDADHSEVANCKTGEEFSTNESTQEVLRTTKILELKSDETVSVKNATPDANMVSKENHSEVFIGKTGTQEGSSTTKVFELKKNEMILAKTATPDANMVAKEQVQTEVANGRTGESETTNNGNNPLILTKSQKKNRRKALKKKLYLDSVVTSVTVDNKPSSPAGTTNLNGNVEVQKKMETSSGTNATDNTTLKKIKRQKMENNNLDSGDNLSAHESTQEGLGTTKVLEVKGDETVLDITATIDANVVSKDHSEVANGETGEIETTNLNVSGKEKRKRKPKSNNKQPTLGENLDPVYLQNLEAAKHDNLVSNEQKRQKINDNSALGDILSTCENTSKVPQAVSADVSQGEEHMKDANVNDVGKEETEPKVQEKKLIILDVNGLLADIVSDLPDDIIADKYITRRAIFKRPYVDEFLSFCFERFHVGIWSSRFMRNLVPVVNFLLGDLKKQLLFLWDGCKCTDSGVGTLDVQYKNIVVKDLRKIWDEDGPNNKWVKGTFTESNTLLVDDSPYKGLLNPKYTGIFPASYSYLHSDDNLLGPNGELQTYLEGLAAADDVKTYVEQHPFGQGVIDEQSPDWVFYSSLIERLNDKSIMERLEKENKWKRRRCC